MTKDFNAKFKVAITENMNIEDVNTAIALGKIKSILTPFELKLVYGHAAGLMFDYMFNKAYDSDYLLIDRDFNVEAIDADHVFDADPSKLKGEPKEIAKKTPWYKRLVDKIFG